MQQPGSSAESSAAAQGKGADGAPDGILEDRLRLLYGNHLFASGAWDEGAAQLALCRCEAWVFNIGLPQLGTSSNLSEVG